MKQGIVSIFVIVFTMLSTSVYSSTMKSSCVNCHTDEKVLKTQVKLPETSGGEGEG